MASHQVPLEAYSAWKEITFAPDIGLACGALPLSALSRLAAYHKWVNSYHMVLPVAAAERCLQSSFAPSWLSFTDDRGSYYIDQDETSRI